MRLKSAIRTPAGFDSLPGSRPKKSEPTGTIMSDADKLVLWLNAAKGTHSYDRILEIHRLLSQLLAGYAEYAKRSDEQDAEVFHGRYDPKIFAAQGEWLGAQLKWLGGLHMQLNLALSRYMVTPQSAYWLTASAPFPKGWSFFMVSQPDDDGFELQYGDQRHGMTLVESDAALSLLRLAEVGDLAKLRLCEQCKNRWRISFRKMDKFCSDECRSRNYVESPESKARQRANQKEYRKRLKLKENREAAAFKKLDRNKGK
jgi:hypothetical protein